MRAFLDFLFGRPASPGPKTRKLINTLSEMEELLVADGDELWVGAIATAKKRLLDSDYSGVELVYSLYGGMGSFTEAYVSTGQRRFHKLKDQAYKLSLW